jgi:hypothetical protein
MAKAHKHNLSHSNPEAILHKTTVCVRALAIRLAEARRITLGTLDGVNQIDLIHLVCPYAERFCLLFQLSHFHN